MAHRLRAPERSSAPFRVSCPASRVSARGIAGALVFSQPAVHVQLAEAGIGIVIVIVIGITREPAAHAHAQTA